MVVLKSFKYATELNGLLARVVQANRELDEEELMKTLESSRAVSESCWYAARCLSRCRRLDRCTSINEGWNSLASWVTVVRQKPDEAYIEDRLRLLVSRVHALGGADDVLVKAVALRLPSEAIHRDPRAQYYGKSGSCTLSALTTKSRSTFMFQDASAEYIANSLPMPDQNQKGWYKQFTLDDLQRKRRKKANGDLLQVDKTALVFFLFVSSPTHPFVRPSICPAGPSGRPSVHHSARPSASLPVCLLTVSLSV